MQFVFYNSFSERNAFEMSEGKRPWDVFLVLKEGKIEVEFNGDGNIITAKAGEIVYFPVNTPMTRCVIEPISFHQLGVLVDDNKLRKSLTAGVLNIPADHVNDIIASLEVASSLKNDSIYMHYALHIVTEHHIFSQAEGDRPLKSMDDINFVMKYMREHLAEPINIENVAKMVHLSHVGLIWKFNRCLNTTPSEFLFRLRIEKAKQLLLETDLKINEISYLCGFTNPYYFSRRFKEQFNISPKQFRNTMLKV